MQEFVSSIMNIIAMNIRINDIVDILIVAFVIYKILGFIRETRAEQLVKGLLILGAVLLLSKVFKLYTINWILEKTLTIGAFALVVVFQPELRRGLEYIGRSKFVRRQFVQVDKERAKQITAAIVRAVDYFSTNKVGALIIIEREISLNDIIETGTVLNAEITTELLGNIFYEGAPLHDGAAIIRGSIVVAAGCVLPLTENKSLSSELGTRHRAGIGITENSDALSLIVSEESGIISMAVDGKLTRFLDVKAVEKTLLNLYFNPQLEDEKKNPFRNLFRRNENDELK